MKRRKILAAAAAVGLLVLAGMAFFAREKTRVPTTPPAVVTHVDLTTALPDTTTNADERDAPAGSVRQDAATPPEGVSPASRASTARVLPTAAELSANASSTAAAGADATPDGDTVPRAWRLHSPFPDAYRLGSDHAVVWQGSTSARIENVLPESSQRSFGGALQTIRADAYRAKRVRFSAFVKTRGADAATIAIGADDENGTQVTGKFMLVDERREFPVRGSNGWSLLTMVIEIPEQAVVLNYGAFLLGNGVLWADTARLEIVDATIPSTDLPARRSPPHVSEPPRIQELAAAPMNMDFEDVERAKR